MSSKGPWAKCLYQPMVLLGDGGTFRKWGLVEGRKVVGGVPLREYWNPSPFLFLSLLPSQLATSSSTCFPPPASSQAWKKMSNES
jgi:hypothetical protein